MSMFSGKAVLVTGAGTGIGYALCQAFASEDATVALNDIDLDLCARAAQQINSAVGAERVTPYAGDIADVEAIRAIFQRFTEAAGRLDIVIANAGITNYGNFLTYTPDAFDRLTSVNLRGSFFTAQTAANSMIKARIPGRIILMSSVTGIQAHANLEGYGITKAGIRMMARGIALDLGKYGITVNAICPGATLTERTLLDDPNYEASWAGVTPTGRVGNVEDIVAAALYLASPQARHVTGQTLVIDGGWTLQSPLPSAHPDLPEYSSQLR
ncbi:SDR family NAD(P)-dependent oxidoreductase [Ktedonobacter robiniae]|uniref:3-oxoacyl-ACP reductase n=1 Tax=Ktedonobacter robiniae TaxID=2778365 RepID=A0ABQ3V5C5_9CHLR|nr:SDR family NAD(P)-dependent oxidoreductase [Ktedonobacter robiniae]GHO60218.1 3-oxoacyl-ACP reductase [Ktedonobacter robiniae]